MPGRAIVLNFKPGPKRGNEKLGNAEKHNKCVCLSQHFTFSTAFHRFELWSHKQAKTMPQGVGSFPIMACPKSYMLKECGATHPAAGCLAVNRRRWVRQLALVTFGFSGLKVFDPPGGSERQTTVKKLLGRQPRMC